MQATNTLWAPPPEDERELSLSRELSTNEIALFAIVFNISAEFAQKHLHSMENININIKMFLQNLKCCSTTTKDLLCGKRYF